MGGSKKRVWWEVGKRMGRWGEDVSVGVRSKAKERVKKVTSSDGVAGAVPPKMESSTGTPGTPGSPGV